MVLGAGAFGRWVSQEGRSHMSENCALLQEAPESWLILSTMWGHSQKSAVCNPERSLTRSWLKSHLHLGPPTSRTMGKILLLFISGPVCAFLNFIFYFFNMKFIVKLVSIQHPVLIPTGALPNAHHPLRPSHPPSTFSLFSVFKSLYWFGSLPL